MSEKEIQSYGINALKKLASELGRIPRVDEFIIKLPMYDFSHLFGSYDYFLKAAGLHVLQNSKPEKFRYRKSMLESFNIVERSIDDLFEVNGNPSVIRVMARPDSHIEEKDEIALKLYEDFANWYKPHVDLIMGDFIGAGGVSHWDAKDLKPKRLIPEIREARKVLESFIAATPETKTRIYLTGNHEDWIEQAMIKNLPEMFDGMDELDGDVTPNLKKLLNLDKYGYDLIELNHILKIGKAHFTHGFYTGNNHPQVHLNKIKASIYYGHLHDMKNTHDSGLHGTIEAASLGCLCRVDGKFLKGKPTNWIQGFGVFEFFPDGTYSFYQVKIFNGKFSFNGKVFKYEEK